MEKIIKDISVKRISFKELLKVNGYGEYIPPKVILNKGLPGIGATRREIECKRNSILICPYKAIIDIKKEFYGDKVIAIYGEYEKEDAVKDILDYLNNDRIAYKKILTTPESFNKVKAALEIYSTCYTEDFFMLIDECDAFVENAIFRKKLVGFMDEFFTFHNCSMISATPIIPSDPRFEERGFKHLMFQPKFKLDNELKLIVTNSVVETARDIIDYQFKMNKQPTFIFTNCKQSIGKLASQFEDSKIFCSENLRDEFFVPLGFKNVETSINNHQWAEVNILTSRFFCGVDIMLEDKKPNVIIISDAVETPHSMVHPLYSVLQIYGRLRNGISSITHITTVFDCDSKSENDISTDVNKELYHLLELSKLKQSLSPQVRRHLKEAMEKCNGFEMLNPSGNMNSYFVDNYLFSRLEENLYSNEQTLADAYEKSLFKNVKLETVYIPNTDRDLSILRVAKNKKLAQEVLRQLVLLVEKHGLFRIANLNDSVTKHLNELRKSDPLIYGAYFSIGAEEIVRLNYNRRKIRDAIWNATSSDERNNLQMLDEILDSFKPFMNKRLYLDRITSMLDEVYSRFNAKDKNIKPRKAKGTDIEEYFECNRINGKKKVDGIYQTYYVLLKPRHRHSSDFLK